MKYFAYGSNMSPARLRERTPGAQRIGSYVLQAHDLRFHKRGRDGSGKCNALYTRNLNHRVFGVLFEICPGEMKDLDKAEGLGYGYDQKTVIVVNDDCSEVAATVYCATDIDEQLRPYTWYKQHVLVGAKESSLPGDYIQKIESVVSVADPDEAREARQYSIQLSHEAAL